MSLVVGLWQPKPKPSGKNQRQPLPRSRLVSSLTNIYEAGNGFKILHTTKRSQMASMILEPDESSSEEPNTHPESDQTLIVLDGKLTAEIAGKRAEMNKGDAVTVP